MTVSFFAKFSVFKSRTFSKFPCLACKRLVDLYEIMEKIATENLFLLEFLVDNVKLDPRCECDAPPGENCVSFQFLDNSPLDVCEADFTPKRNIKQDDSVKSGKSCLFSLSPEQAQQATEQFDINVSVMRKMQPGWLPDKVEIGAAIISVSNLFNELISSVELSDGSTPTAKTLKDVFDINDPSAKTIGQISVYIRMSCFGKLIVTQFQMNLDDKSVLFKDKEGKSLYRYKRAGKDKGEKRESMQEQQGISQRPRYNPNCPQTPCFPDGSSPNETGSPFGSRPTTGLNEECPFAPCPLDGSQNQPVQPQFPGAQMPYGGMMPFGGMMAPGGMGGMMAPGGMGGMMPPGMSPCNECGGMQMAPCIPPGGGMPYDPAMMTGRPGSPGMGYPGALPEPEGNYQEIGASMGGNSLTIRVHKDKNKIEEMGADDGCTCDEGFGGGAFSGGGGNIAQRNQAFAMRPGVPNPNTPFAFRMGQMGDARGGDNNVVVNPPVCTAADGTQFTEFSDPNKEMFILRIGKKSEGIDKKNNLELELQTPKGPPLKPIPKKETIETQYDPLDCAEGGVGKARKAEKNGGKGGKGGKGKKK